MSIVRAPADSVQVLVVGGGPVGLFAALCAVQRGLSVRIVDQVWRGYAPGRAALLHGRSLELLEGVELLPRIQELGHRIDSLSLHIRGSEVAHLPLPSPALAVPQSVIEDVLSSALRKADVQVEVPYQAVTIEQRSPCLEVRMLRRELVTLGSPAHHDEWEPVDSSIMQAGFVVGADGYDSRVRSAIGVDPVLVGKTEVFAIFEGPAASPVSGTMRLFFDDESSGAILPLPGGRVRCTFEVNDRLDAKPDLHRLRELLAEKAPSAAAVPAEVEWGTVVHFERRLARDFAKGCVVLAGDAAHVTSPLGHQSLNAGLFEASDIASRIANSVNGHTVRDGVDGYGATHAREWHKMLGVNVRFDLLSHAEPWVPAYARRLVSGLPASGTDLIHVLERVGLRLS